MAEWSTKHPPETYILTDAARKDHWTTTFENLAEELETMANFMFKFRNQVSDDRWNHPAYTEASGNSKYNPNFGVIREQTYTLMDLFKSIQVWYECWAPSIGEILRLSETVMPLPRTVDEAVAGSWRVWKRVAVRL
ncbi:hypothetical protein TWF506_010668 [Arthrobotrys conoides]|uniref:Uncharacterized protein n=1 Tax=Arthrobotrys conoides TaxID=74498 RepID=A0AAN8N1Z2_9PEZI